MIDGPPTRERMILAELALSTTIQLVCFFLEEEICLRILLPADNPQG